MEPSKQEKPTAEGRAISRVRRCAGAWAPIAIAALAFLLRLVYLWSARRSPLFESLGLDAQKYDLWARRIVAHDSTGSSPFFMGPLYPYFLAVLYRLGLDSVFQVALVQAAVDSTTCALLFVSARRLWDRAWAGWAAGLLAAFYGPMMGYTGELLYPTLAAFVNALFLCLLLLADKRTSLRLLFASGVVLGLAAFGNAVSLLYYPAVILWWLLRRPRPTRTQLIRHALVLLAGVAVIVLPVAARNRMVGHDWVLLTSNGGLNFYIGNNLLASGAYVKPHGVDNLEDPEGRRIAEAARGRTLRPSEVSSYWASEAWAFIRDNPRAFLSGLVKKLVFSWNAFEIPQVENFGFQSRYSLLLRLPFPTFGWLVPLALVALVLADARRRAALPASLVVVHSLAIAMFFVTGRYRLPIVPFLIVLAAGGILSLVDVFTARRRRALGIILFAAAAALTHANFYRVNRETGFAEFEFRLGLFHERNGDLVKAEESYRAALAREAFHPGARLNLGGILSRTGRAEEGLHLIQGLSAKRPDDELTQLNLALILADLGRHDEARAAFERAIQVNPKNTQAWHGYGIESYRVGDLTMARRAFETLSTRKENAQWVQQSQFLLAKMENGSSTREGQDSAAVAMRLGDLRAAVGDWQGASDAFHKAADLQPTSQAFFEWGQAAYRLHNAGEAIAALGQCLKLDPRFPGAHMVLASVHFERKDYDAALEACEREADISPSNPEVFFRLGFLYENHLKDIPAALRAYRRYIEIGGPRAEPIRQKLASLEARMHQGGDSD